MKKIVPCVIAVLAVLVVVHIAWEEATSTTTQQPKRGGVLRTAVNYDPPHFDPQMTLSYQTHCMVSFVYSKILRDKQGEDVDPYSYVLQPDLAIAWEVISPTEIVYTLRKGVKFHNKPPVNGREVTSADIKYTMERILDPAVKSPNRSFYDKIKSIETPDPYTVKFTLSEPYAPMVRYTGMTWTSVVAKEVVDKFGDLKMWNSAIGSGPFMMEEYEPNVRILYARNPDYYEKGRPYLDKLEMRIITSPEVYNAAVRTKQLDLGLGTPFTDYEAVQEMLKIHADMKMVEYHNNNWPRVTFATDTSPFNDKRVRQAMSMSFDRKMHMEVVYGGRGYFDSVLTIAMPGSISHDQLGEASKYFQPDKEEAKRLLRAAGLKPPVKIKVAYSPVYGPVFVSAVESFAGQMRSAGTFDVELVPQEYGRYISSTYLGKYKENAVFALTTPPVDPDDILWTMFHSTASRNSARVKDPNVDKLLEAQRREMNEDKRMAILKELQLYLAEQMYYMPTTMAASFDMWFPYVKGYNRHIVPWYNWGDRFRLVWLDK